MAMGGSHHKGIGVHGNNGGNRGKPYGLMLLLAFGAALLGVMIVHKLRERRIYNLLVKEKDHELASLRILLQKERDQTNEMKKKNEEMEAKIYSLRNEKMELDRRFSEVQSTLDSLKDEQSIMEIAFEEKQKEIRLLREKEAKWEKENSEVIFPSERRKQKEAEVEDQKQRLAGNSVVNQSSSKQDKTEITENKGNDMGLHESRYTTIDGDENLRDEDSIKSSLKLSRVEDENVDARGGIDRREMASAEMLKQKKLEDGGERITGEDRGKRVRNEGTGEEDNGEKELDDREDASTQSQKFKNFMDGRLLDIDLKDVSQQRKADNSAVASNSAKIKRPHLKKGRAKRWRAIVKSQLLGDNGFSGTNEAVVRGRNRNVYKDDKEQLRDGIQGVGSSDVGDEVVADNSIKVSAKSKVLKPEDVKETDGEVAEQRVEEVQGWTDSGRHIKKEDDNAQHETGYPKRTQETGDEDDGGGYDAKESDSDNEDEKEYKDK